LSVPVTAAAELRVDLASAHRIGRPIEERRELLDDLLAIGARKAALALEEFPRLGGDLGVRMARERLAPVEGEDEKIDLARLRRREESARPLGPREEDLLRLALGLGRHRRERLDERRRDSIGARRAQRAEKAARELGRRARVDLLEDRIDDLGFGG